MGHVWQLSPDKSYRVKWKKSSSELYESKLSPQRSGSGPSNHFLINISSNRLRHSYHSSQMLVREWLENSFRIQELMQQLQISSMLNSNEKCRLDDSFSLHVFHIRDAGQGSGNKIIRKGTMALEKLLDRKKSVFKIKNEDELCCACATVTMKAYCDLCSQHNDYRSLQRGFPDQGKNAKELHRAAGVPERPCSLPEIKTFQRHLTDYRSSYSR